MSARRFRTMSKNGLSTRVYSVCTSPKIRGVSQCTGSVLGYVLSVYQWCTLGGFSQSTLVYSGTVCQCIECIECTQRLALVGTWVYSIAGLGGYSGVPYTRLNAMLYSHDVQSLLVTETIANPFSVSHCLQSLISVFCPL